MLHRGERHPRPLGKMVTHPGLSIPPARCQTGIPRGRPSSGSRTWPGVCPGIGSHLPQRGNTDWEEDKVVLPEVAGFPLNTC